MHRLQLPGGAEASSDYPIPGANYFKAMKPEYLTNPHDKFFKESFNRKEIVESFIIEYLPAHLHSRMDLGTLAILKDSFIDKELSEHFSDILYTIKLAGKKSYLYLLFEHKSYIDPLVGFQLLRNMVKIWEGYLKQNPKARHLPLIVPVVIYHGSKKWHVENSLLPLFDTVPGAECYIPDFKSEMFDISHLPDDQIKGVILLQVLLLVQKYIFRPDLFEKLHDIFKLLQQLSNKTTATEYLEVLLRYLVASVDSTRTNDIKKELTRTIAKGDNLMPTIAEKWYQDGVKEGIEEGKIEDGLKMIAKGMTNADIRDITGLSIKKIQELRNKADKS
jgi:predicted transposase/invertase (TIGR01784 family)